MTTETNTTDFDTVRRGFESPSHYRIRMASASLSRIEASHSALVAQRDALLAALEAILADIKSENEHIAHRMIQQPTTRIARHAELLEKAEAAISLAKGAK